jgi:hypothetical protein
MSSERTDDGHEPDEASTQGFEAVTDEFGTVLGIGPINVADLLYRSSEEFGAGPRAAALARMAHDGPDPAEGRLLTLRYIEAARARDDVAKSEIVQVLGEQKLITNLVTFVTAAWAELGQGADEMLATLTRYAVLDICGSVSD